MSTNNETKYFDLHLTGVARLARVRDIPVRRGPGFSAVDVHALWGTKNEDGRDNTTKLDCRISGAPAKVAIEHLRSAIEAGKSVVVGFSAGDPSPDIFQYRSGPKAGQTGASIKARLLKIRWARVDGQTIDLPGVETSDPEMVPLTLRGLGYLNGVRQFDDGSSASIAALHGATDGVEYTYIQASVSNGAEAPIEALKANVDAKDKVMIGFEVRYPYLKTFTYKAGKRAGQTGANLKGELTEVTWAKVNGQVVE